MDFPTTQEKQTLLLIPITQMRNERKRRLVNLPKVIQIETKELVPRSLAQSKDSVKMWLFLKLSLMLNIKSTKGAHVYRQVPN